MLVGERQVAPTLDGIRRDHLARYEWVSKYLPKRSRVIDAACGVGYGSVVLAKRLHTVVSVDRDSEAVAYAREHYSHVLIEHRVADLSCGHEFTEADAAVCFETIEHLADPVRLLQSFHKAAPLLIASVPNQRKFPWRGQRFHFRHYTKQEFADLLAKAGYEAVEWFGQEGAESEVAKDIQGRTLIVVAKRQAASKQAAPKKRPAVDLPFLPPPDKPVKRVAILGLGPSLDTYTGLVKRMGGRHRMYDEVWGINAVLDVMQCDVGFHMDDVRIQQIRADAEPSGNIAAMLPWLKRHNGPIFTSRADPEYPGLIEYPLAAVLNSCRGQRYFNSTAAYAVAYAIHRGVESLHVYGNDFTYPGAQKAEQGRGCVEFWLGFAIARGMNVGVPGLQSSHPSSLLDACMPPELRFYGYDTVQLKIEGDDGKETVTMTPRDALPTAEEIEARYDHNKHPNPLVRESASQRKLNRPLNG